MHPNNRFIFGAPSQYHQQGTFQACNLIRKFCLESDVENPGLLRTRLLRQHLATETARSHPSILVLKKEYLISCHISDKFTKIIMY